MRTIFCFHASAQLAVENVDNISKVQLFARIQVNEDGIAKRNPLVSSFEQNQASVDQLAHLQNPVGEFKAISNMFLKQAIFLIFDTSIDLGPHLISPYTYIV